MAPKKRPASALTARPSLSKKGAVAVVKKRPAAAAVKKRPAAAVVKPLAKRPATQPASRNDGSPSPCPHSVANFREAVVEHLDLSLKVDFDREVFSGCCELRVRVVDPTRPPAHVILDSLHLAIESVTDDKDIPVPWEVQKPDGFKSKFGDALVLDLPKDRHICVFRIRYETTAQSSAIQWLAKEQTQGKKHPLCFTQSQAICGRSLIPCQDTPCVKMPFVLRVSVPAALVAIASGEPVGEPVESEGIRTFTYKQDVPVMSYLIAVLVGDLEVCEIGPRSRCYAEPAVINAAQAEYKDIVEEFLVAAQAVVGGSDYAWGSYNIAILPSSFAYGGMENPNCTFMSASLIAGDRSLTTTLAHEIVHSWAGNLVTNAYWKDFWLNEGFTRYIERRLLGQLYGDAFRSLLLMVGYNDLVKNLEMLCNQGSSKLTCLEPDLVGIDPDEAFSRVPYEKGSLFLFYLEQVVGGPQQMTDWLRAYVDEFRGRSIETSDFRRHFLSFFKDVDGVKHIDWKHWLKGEGLPKFDLSAHVDSTLLGRCKALSAEWLREGAGYTILQLLNKNLSNKNSATNNNNNSNITSSCVGLCYKQRN